MKFLIDECLSMDLVLIASAAGYEAQHVVRIGKAGWKDWNVARYASDGDYVFLVTNNAVDFRRLYEASSLHAGLVILIPNVGRQSRCQLFEALRSLRHLVNRSTKCWKPISTATTWSSPSTTFLMLHSDTPDLQHQTIVLASQSGTRAALLRGAGIAFEARPARIDEAAVKAAGLAEGWSADDLALTLAGMKAERIRAPGQVVVGADQVLVCEDNWFDKPVDSAAARDQLLALRGRSHTLVTAMVCLKDGREIWHHVASPTLTMRPFSDGFLDAYLALEGDHVLASVGAYRLEGPGIQLFDHVEGEFSAILGLPLLPLMGFLRQHGVLMG